MEESEQNHEWKGLREAATGGLLWMGNEAIEQKSLRVGQFTVV